ncbi:MAG TPA: flagellar basal body-associated protein FliL [Hyphomicrobiales bacterium]|nr:flagellar basal body-associated protein FliL [Hyphomicrobiales bacterium]
MASVAEAEDGAAPDEAEAGAAKPKKSKKKLIMFAAPVLLLVVAGGGYMYMGHGKKAEPAAQVKPPPTFMDLPDVMVNLQSPADRPRYLRLKIALEVADPKVEEKITPLMPRVLDAFQTHLRELRASDLDGSAGLYRLKEELLKRIDQAIYPAKIDAVLFKEMLVQ